MDLIVYKDKYLLIIDKAGTIVLNLETLEKETILISKYCGLCFEDQIIFDGVDGITFWDFDQKKINHGFITKMKFLNKDKIVTMGMFEVSDNTYYKNG